MAEIKNDDRKISRLNIFLPARSTVIALFSIMTVRASDSVYAKHASESWVGLFYEVLSIYLLATCTFSILPYVLIVSRVSVIKFG